jgi:hypothetical protein
LALRCPVHRHFWGLWLSSDSILNDFAPPMATTFVNRQHTWRKPPAVTECRFPPPWTVEEQAACFVVRDHSGQALP